jgi:hypothetical protein
MPTCAYIGQGDYTQLKPICCAPSVKGKSYCAEHVWYVYQKGSAVHRRKDARQAHSLADIINDINEVYEELLLEGLVSDLDEA